MKEKRTRPLSWTPESEARRRDFRRALVCAVGVHALLFVALFFAFQWKTQDEDVMVELWAETPTTGTNPNGGPAVEPPPAPSPAPEPAPAPSPAPREQSAAAAKPRPQPLQKDLAEEQRKADIVQAEERRRQEKLKEKQLQEQKRQQELQKKADEAKKAAEAKRRAAEEAQKAAQAQAAARAQAAAKVRTQEAARMAAARVRSQELARTMGGAASSRSAGTPTGDRTAQFQNLSGSARAGFIAKVRACIRPNIIFSVPSGVRRGQYQAVYRVRLMPSGDQIGSPQKLKASGLAGYDAAVERAIAKCSRFPSVP
ncbi:MAG: TonB C-terminal domain-containing protein, partial [Mesosutterella sp.]|nr:TonB C-terminal domain-containing protein [Mesosutterella sp.]